jgi:hypothetical protein
MNIIKKLLLSLVIYVPLEEFILKWIPVSTISFEYLHFTSDAIILFCFLFYHYIKGVSFKKHRENNWATIFIISTLFSLLVYQPWYDYIFKVWVLLRYFIVFTLIRNTFKDRDYEQFYNLFYKVFVFQVFVGMVQLLDIPFFIDIFSPRSGLHKADNWLTKGESGLAGTFQFTVQYGYYFFAASTLIIIKETSRIKKNILLFICLLASLLSFSTMSFILTFGLIYYFHSKSISLKRRIVQNALAVVGLAFISLINIHWIYNIIESISLISSNFIEASLTFSRLGVFKTFPLFFQNDLFNIFFGFSLNGELITSIISNRFEGPLPHVLRNNLTIGLEDVYWAAHLYYFGLFGLVSYLLIFLSFKKQLKLGRYYANSLHAKIKILTVNRFISITFLAAFVNQIFSFKTFTIYLFFIIAYSIHSNLLWPKHRIN